MSVVVVGSINIDLHLRPQRHPRPGETLLAGGGDRSPGGKGANQACAAALAGATTAMLGAVGDDDAEVALGLLRKAGVDLQRLHHAEGPTGLAVVTVDEAGENTVVVVPGANASVAPEVVDGWADVLAGAEMLVLQGEIPAASSERAAGLAKGRVLLNLAPVIEVGPALLRRSDPLVVNEHEGAMTLKQLGGSACDEPADIVAALLAAGVPSVVMTLGSAGALVADGDQTTTVPSPTVKAVDSVGAGDAFVGSLAAKLAAGESLAQAARYACRFAAYTVQFDGAQSSYPMPGTELPDATS